MKSTLTLVAALLLSPLAALQAADAKATTKPNLILIVAADLG